MQQTEWEALNVREIPCPKCGVVGKLIKLGRDRHKKYYRVDCNNCQASSSERLLSIPKGKQPAPVTPNLARSSNNTLERLTRLEDMLEKVLQGQGVEIKPAEAKTETTGNLLVKPWDKWAEYSLETQDRIEQELLPIIREHSDLSARDLQTEVKKGNRYGKALRLQVIVEVREAFVNGVFGL